MYFHKIPIEFGRFYDMYFKVDICECFDGTERHVQKHIYFSSFFLSIKSVDLFFDLLFFCFENY